MRRPALAACLALAACSFGVDDGAARYHCDDGQTCPPGTTCTGGYCEPAGAGPDAAADITCSAGANVQATFAAGRSAQSHIAWGDGKYALVWTQFALAAHVELDLLDVDGDPRKNALTLSSPSHVGVWPTVEWTGSVFGAFWADRTDNISQLAYRAVAGDGSPPADLPVELGASESGAVPSRSQVIAGDQQGVAWQNRNTIDGNDEVNFRLFDAAGNATSELRPVTENLGASWFPSLAWTGSEWGVAWNDDRDGNIEIYFTRLDATGDRLEGDRRITDAPGASFAPSLIWTGDAYIVTWWDARADPTEMFAARLVPGDNTTIGPEVRLRPGEYGQVGMLARSGERIGLVWHSFLDGIVSPVFALLDPDTGALLTAPLPLSDGGVEIDLESLAVTGVGADGFAVVWADDRNEDVEIYFTRVTCQ